MWSHILLMIVNRSFWFNQFCDLICERSFSLKPNLINFWFHRNGFQITIHFDVFNDGVELDHPKRVMEVEALNRKAKDSKGIKFGHQLSKAEERFIVWLFYYLECNSRTIFETWRFNYCEWIFIMFRSTRIAFGFTNLELKVTMTLIAKFYHYMNR